MRDHWRADACYAEYGVDGSECSFRVYLSEVENWCPLLPGRTIRPRNATISAEQVCHCFHVKCMKLSLEKALYKFE